mmetsp:Transcript_5599/g.7831  ORF Transcript_5599/g.7831 Transcript_5599/m.7831 type:complete len:102 (-) Transcript_5599:143-448(-)
MDFNVPHQLIRVRRYNCADEIYKPQEGKCIMLIDHWHFEGCDIPGFREPDVDFHLYVEVDKANEQTLPHFKQYYAAQAKPDKKVWQALAELEPSKFTDLTF